MYNGKLYFNLSRPSQRTTLMRCSFFVILENEILPCCVVKINSGMRLCLQETQLLVRLPSTTDSNAFFTCNLVLRSAATRFDWLITEKTALIDYHDGSIQVLLGELSTLSDLQRSLFAKLRWLCLKRYIIRHYYSSKSRNWKRRHQKRRRLSEVWQWQRSN